MAKYTRESPFPTLPVKEAVNQQATASTLSSQGEDVSNVDTSKHLVKGRGNELPFLSVFKQCIPSYRLTPWLDV